MVMRRHPEKKYFLISVELANEVGALSEVLRVLAIRELNILEGYSCVKRKEREAVWSCVVETKNPRMDTNFLRELLEGSDYVEKVEIEESHGGLIIDSLNFPVIWGGGERCVVLSSGFINQSFEEAMVRFGEIASGFIYEIGTNYGSSVWASAFGAAHEDIEASLREATKLLSASGVARAEVIDFNRDVPSVTFSLLDSFECAKAESKVPHSHFVRGILCGAVSAAFKQNLKSVESECIALGDKRCLVVVSPLTSASSESIGSGRSDQEGASDSALAIPTHSFKLNR